MKRLLILLAAVAALTFVGCEKRELPVPKPTEGSQPDEPDVPVDPGEETLVIADAPYKVVAHRGGSSECGFPDNSRAALRYAMQMKCYASECDIYWTKDNNVIIGHADNDCKINGLHPWEATVEDLRRAGKLKNGEDLPTLDDFLDIVMVKGNCTRLWLDIKNITSPSTLTQYPSKAVERSCEIIKERKADQWCEFICTGNATVAGNAAACQKRYGIPVGWMANQAPAGVKAAGFTWANLNASNAMKTPTGTGNHTVDEFYNAKVDISVFNVDKQKGDGNAVYSDDDIAWYVEQYPKMKAICTNYPSWLINKVKNRPLKP